MYIKKIAQTPELQATVIDNLDSDSNVNALSAKQGKVLNEKIGTVSEVPMDGIIAFEGDEIPEGFEEVDSNDLGFINKKISVFSGDLDTIKETGFTYASGSGTHIPQSGFSWFVTTIALNNNYVIQTAQRADSDQSIIYERQCKGGVWASWRHANFAYMGEIKNFNSTTKSGIYKYGGQALDNKPPNWAVLEVIDADGYIIQRCSNDGMISTRISYDGGASWNAWKKVALT